MHHLKNLTKGTEVCKTQLKRKGTSNQNLWHVKTKSWKNFITVITKTIEIFYLHSSKGLNKVFHKLLQWKHQRYKEYSERYKNFSISETKKTINLKPQSSKMKNTLMNQFQFLILSITFFTSVAEIVHSKVKFSNKSFRNFLSSEISDSFIITFTNKGESYKIISLNSGSKKVSQWTMPF